MACFIARMSLNIGIQNMLELVFAVLAFSFNEKLIKVQGLISTFDHHNALAQALFGTFHRIDENLLQVILIDNLHKLISDKVKFSFIQVLELLVSKDELFSFRFWLLGPVDLNIIRKLIAIREDIFELLVEVVNGEDFL